MATTTKDTFFDEPIKPEELSSDTSDTFFDEPIKPEELEDFQPSGISKLESATRGIAQEGSFGFADELSAAATAGLEKVGEMIPGTDLYKLKKLRDEGFKGIGGEDKYSEAKDLYREADLSAEKANPKSYLAGQIAGGIASSAVGGAGLAKAGTKVPALAKALESLSSASKGAKILPKIAAGATAGAGYGAVSGVGKSEADSLGELASDVGESTLLGATTGAVLPVAGKILKSGVDAGKYAVKGVGNLLGKLATNTGGDKYERISALLNKTGSRIDDITPQDSVERLNNTYSNLEKQTFDKVKQAEQLLDTSKNIPANNVMDTITSALQGERQTPNIQDKSIINYIRKEINNQKSNTDLPLYGDSSSSASNLSGIDLRNILKDIGRKGWSKEGMPLNTEASSSFRNAYGVMKKIVEDNASEDYANLMKSASSDKQTLSKMKRILGYKKVGRDFSEADIADELSKTADENLDVVEPSFFKQDFSEVQPLDKTKKLIDPKNTAIENTLKRVEAATKDVGLTEDLTLQAVKEHIDNTLEGTLIANPGNLLRMFGLTKGTLWLMKNQPALAKFAPSQVAKALENAAESSIAKVTGQPAAQAISQVPRDVASFVTSPRGATMIQQEMKEDKRTVQEKTDDVVAQDPTDLFNKASAKLDPNSPVLKTLENVLSEENQKTREDKLRNLMRQPGFRRLFKE